jgi:hypothetical protein
LRLLPSPGSIERMAVPARPASPADARVACPTCGGLIHPVAGRCKHCKTDLSAAHATRLARHAAPQVAALPALGGAAAAAAAPAPGPAAPSSPWAPPQAGAAPADATRPLAPFSEVPVPVYGRVGETPRPLPGGQRHGVYRGGPRRVALGLVGGRHLGGRDHRDDRRPGVAAG